MSIIHGKNVVLSCLKEGSYQKLGGMSVTDMLLESNYVRNNNVTDSEWEVLSPSSSLRSLRLSGDGVFYTNYTEALLANIAYQGASVDMRLSLDDQAYVEGEFVIERYNYQSNTRSLLAFSISLRSSGEIIFS